MNTYGVSLDGYKPSLDCEEVIIKAIPVYEKTLEDDERAVAVLEKTLALYKDARDGFEALWAASEKLNSCLEAEVPSSGEALKRKLSLAETGPANELLADRVRLTELLSKAIGDTAAEVNDIKSRMSIRRTVLEFYRAFLERRQLAYVFRNVEMKYKVKVCRDAIKAFAELRTMCDRCRVLIEQLPPEARAGFLPYLEDCARNAEAQIGFFREFKKRAEKDGAEVVVQVVRLQKSMQLTDKPVL